jgi:hypothetical protein
MSINKRTVVGAKAKFKLGSWAVARCTPASNAKPQAGVKGGLAKQNGRQFCLPVPKRKAVTKSPSALAQKNSA